MKAENEWRYFFCLNRVWREAILTKTIVKSLLVSIRQLNLLSRISVYIFYCNTLFTYLLALFFLCLENATVFSILRNSLMQILELPSHQFYVGVQFHPEFKSRPGRPSALFLGTFHSWISHSYLINQWSIWSINWEPFTQSLLILVCLILRWSIRTFAALVWLLYLPDIT